MSKLSKKRIEKIYDGFKGKQDITKKEFVRRVQALQNPVAFSEDLGAEMARRQERNTRNMLAQRRRDDIDKAVQS